MSLAWPRLFRLAVGPSRTPLEMTIVMVQIFLRTR